MPVLRGEHGFTALELSEAFYSQKDLTEKWLVNNSVIVGETYVKVIKKLDSWVCCSFDTNGWCGAQDDTIGRVGRVVGIYSCDIEVEFDNIEFLLKYPVQCLVVKDF